MDQQEFKNARLALPTTQAALAKYLQVTPRQISRYENGDKIPRAIELLLNHLAHGKRLTRPRAS